MITSNNKSIYVLRSRIYKNILASTSLLNLTTRQNTQGRGHRLPNIGKHHEITWGTFLPIIILRNIFHFDLAYF